MHTCECVNVINGMQRFRYVLGVLPQQCYSITWGILIPQWTHAHMRMTECDHKTHGGGANVITLMNPEEGGRAGILYMYIAPKDFLIKIPEPTGCPYALRRLNDRLYWTQGKTPTEWTIGGASVYELLGYWPYVSPMVGYLPKGFPYVGCSWNLHQST
jgi:hypothetical protein